MAKNNGRGNGINIWLGQYRRHSQSESPGDLGELFLIGTVLIINSRISFSRFNDDIGGALPGFHV